MLTIKRLSIENRVELSGITIKPGDIVHILGPNGSGKSSLLGALSGLQPFDGDVLFNDQNLTQIPLTELAQYRAYLPQQSTLAFNLTVGHYLSLAAPQTSRAQNMQALTEAVDLICQKLVIADKLDSGIFALSGGELQRVRLAATILQVWPSLNPDARLLILDEPAAPLDVGQQTLLYEFLNEIAAMGLTVVVANHDLNKSLRYAKTVLLLKAGKRVAFGESQAVMTAKQLSQTFDTHIELTHYQDKPLLVIN